MDKVSSILYFLILAFVLSACSGNGGGSSSPVKPPAGNEQIESKPADFPRTFSASFRVQDNETAEFISKSIYTKTADKSLLGCMETPDGKNFTFVMKNESEYPDDLKIQVRNAYFRENKEEYKDLTDIALDGFTRNKWFEFNSTEQKWQVHHCEGKMERVKNYLSGYFQCLYAQPKNSDAKLIDFVLEFSCDIIQR